jgi:hypothetical protein
LAAGPASWREPRVRRSRHELSPDCGHVL